MLRDVAKIDRKSVAPENIESGSKYVGLENIESGGRLINVGTVSSGDLASSKFEFTSEHVLYGKLRPYLAKIALPEFDGICSTDIVPVLPGSKLDRRFLVHFLRQPNKVQLANSWATGANLPRLSPTALGNMVVPLPPLDEQLRIAAILDKAEELRIKRRKALAHLETLAQSLFHSMFGDPDPEKDGQPLSSLVPQGDGINYGVIQPGADVAGGKPLIRVSDLALGGVRLTHLKAIAPEIEAQYRRSRLKGTEILVSCVGTIGEIATTNSDVIGFNIARAVARVPIDRPSLRFYVAEYLRTARVKRYFTKELRTVSQPTLNIKQLGDTLVIVPPEDQQDLFAERVSAIERLKDHHREQLDELDALFASLQNQAFKAEL